MKRKIFTYSFINSCIRSIFFAVFVFLVAYGASPDRAARETVRAPGTQAVFSDTLLAPAGSYSGGHSASAACVLSADTGELIYESNAVTKLPMASTTKIMTALVVLENSSLSDKITVTDSVNAAYGSSIYLRPGEALTVEELLYGLLLESGNDAAIALAEGVSGSVEAFVEKMNQKAQLLGLTNTHFDNPHGLASENHYTTAYELARLTYFALQNEDFSRICKTQSYTVRQEEGTPRYFSNHNKLLRTYPGAIGVKTGYTESSGRCLVSAAERDGSTFICVTLGDRNDWRDHKNLLDYAFGSFFAKEYFVPDELSFTYGGKVFKNTESKAILFAKDGKSKGEFTLTLE